MGNRKWIFAGAFLLLAAGCGGAGEDRSAPETGAEPEASEGPAPAGEATPAAGAPGGQAAAATEIVPGLSMRVLEESSGAAAEPGQTAVVHYTGWLHDPSAPDNRGQKFDSSVDRGRPFEFPLGAGAVIRGWDEGVRGMQIGEVRELTIASELAYGERGQGPIPPGATLVFEVALLDLKGGGAATE